VPTGFTSDFPRPTNDDEFEDIVCDVCKIEWEDPNAQRYGRSGQEQHGVDVYGKPLDLGGAYKGAQVKLRAGTKGNRLSKTEIQDEVDAAKSFDLGELRQLIIATSSLRDTHTQRTVEDINRIQIQNGSFGVTAWFWEDITHKLATSPRLLLKHFKDYFSRLTNVEFAERLVEMPLTVTYSGVDDKYPRHLRTRLNAYGVNTTDRGFLGSQDAQVPPDAFVFVSLDNPSGKELTRLAGAAYSAAQRSGSDCPVFMVVPHAFHEEVKSELAELQHTPNRIQLLNQTDSLGSIAKTLFGAAFQYGYKRRGALTAIDIAARNRSQEDQKALLDIDLSSYFSSDSFPETTVWEEEVQPILKDIADRLAQLKSGTRVQIAGNLYLPASVALGFYLNLRIVNLAVWARTAQGRGLSYRYWASDGEASQLKLAEDWHTKAVPGSKSAVIEVSTSESFHYQVEEYITRQDIRPDAWLSLTCPTNYDMRYITEQDAVAVAEQIGRTARSIIATGVSDIHLFLRTPSALAILIGQRLVACGRIHLYWFQYSTYQFAFTLK
jgi:hypothetical protein